MASSTRSSWTGTFSLDLLSIPITLATTTREEREKSIKTICSCHHLPIDQSERCATTMVKGPEKLKGVEMPDGTYRPIPENEWANIEDATKDDALEVLDVQPLSEFPLAFSTGTYFVRAEKGNRAAARSLGTLVAGLGKARMGCVVKLCKASKQDLAVLWSYQGFAVLSMIPLASQFVRPGDAERAHMKVDIKDAAVDSVVALLGAKRNPDGFQWSALTDEGLTLRHALVDRHLADESPVEQPQEAPAAEVDDLMAQLEASIQQANANKQKAAA